MNEQHKARKQIRDGLDPISERQNLRSKYNRLTVAEAIEQCFAARQAQLKGDGKAGRWLSPLKVHILPRIGNRAIEEVNQHVLKTIFDPIWQTKPDAAKKALERVNLTLKHAAALGLDVDLQATMKVRALLGKQRHKATHIPSIAYNQAPKFYTFLKGKSEVAATALRFLILTAARTSEVRLAAFNEVQDNVWIVPAERTKTGIEHRIPLSKEALAIIESRRGLSNFEYVFCSNAGKPLSDMAMSALMRREGYSERPHGFRATFRTWVEEQTDLSFNGMYWNPTDPDCPYGYNPLTYVAAQYRPLVVSGIIETLKQQWSDAWGVRMEHLLRFSLLALLERPGSTLADIVPMFTKKSFRSQVLKHVTDVEVLKFWRDEFPNMNYKNSFDGVAPIANKLGAFLAHPQIRKALCEPEKPLRFRQLMDEGTPLVVNLSKGQLGSDISNVLGGLIVSMMTHAAFTRYNILEHRRRPYFLYADEFHSFTTEAFAGMLSELRKYRLGLILAHQHTGQLQPKVLESILGNVGTMLVFRVGAKDAPLLSKQLGRLPTKPEHLNPANLTELPNYRNYVRLMINGEQSSVFSSATTVST